MPFASLIMFFWQNTIVEILPIINSALLPPLTRLQLTILSSINISFTFKLESLIPSNHFARKTLANLVSLKRYSPLFRLPPSKLLIDDSSGNKRMHMWRIVKSPVVGVQQRMVTDVALALRISIGKAVDGFPGCFHQEIIGGFLMTPKQWPPLCQNCERDQRISELQ